MHKHSQKIDLFILSQPPHLSATNQLRLIRLVLFRFLTILSVFNIESAHLWHIYHFGEKEKLGKTEYLLVAASFLPKLIPMFTKKSIELLFIFRLFVDRFTYSHLFFSQFSCNFHHWITFGGATVLLYGTHWCL